jgi:hypothetical protein
MSRKLLILLPMLLYGIGSLAQRSGRVYVLGPDEILIDPKVLRAQLGYTWMDGRHLTDTLDHRKAETFHMKIETRIFSNMIDKYMNFVVHDAFYLGMDMGKVKSHTIGENLDPGDFNREDKFALNWSFGYDFFLGYRNTSWGLMAGIRPQWSTTSLGDFSPSATDGGLSLLYFARPLAIRGEWHPFSHFEYRIIATAWSSVIGGAPWSGFRLEIPTLPNTRFWLFAEYQKYGYQWEYLSTDKGPEGSFGMITLGIRTGSIF